MSKPDFVTIAREWLVRAQGHARVSDEQSLANELERVFELAVMNLATKAARTATERSIGAREPLRHGDVVAVLAVVDRVDDDGAVRARLSTSEAVSVPGDDVVRVKVDQPHPFLRFKIVPPGSG
jgi:hypothetical protein